MRLPPWVALTRLNATVRSLFVAWSNGPSNLARAPQQTTISESKVCAVPESRSRGSLPLRVSVSPDPREYRGGSAITDTSSKPRKPGSSRKPSSRVVDGAVATSVKLSGVQPPAGMLRWEKNVCPPHEAEKSLTSPPSLRSANETIYALPAVVCSVWERNPSEPTGPRDAPKVPLFTKNEELVTLVKPMLLGSPAVLNAGLVQPVKSPVSNPPLTTSPVPVGDGGGGGGDPGFEVPGRGRRPGTFPLSIVVWVSELTGALVGVGFGVSGMRDGVTPPVTNRAT